MIELEKISKHFSRHVAVRDVSLSVAAGEFLVIVGESGSGKTTLLKMIAGLEKPTAGTITVAGKKLKDINFEASLVFQNAALFPWLDVRQNVSFPFDVTGKNISQKDLDAVLSEVSLGGHADSYPHDLSGGQRQRVGLARALAVKRNILLLDEPFSALDIKTASELHADLLGLWKSRQLTVIMVSHLVEEAVELADRIIIMKDGEIKDQLDVSLMRPRNLESHEFLKLSDKIKEIIEA